ncbi:MAG: pilus assembly protein PilB, partial [Phycisphaerae bacterium]|nr:pilus assembly protein PilB [Phycisphaerae bacterium]
LVRKICTECRTEFKPTEDMLLQLRLLPEEIRGRTFYFGRGCEQCNNSGYKGRTAIFEIMNMHDQLKQLVMEHASTNVLRAEARKRGMRSLRDSGLMAIFDGTTSIEEVVRETVREE